MMRRGGTGGVTSAKSAASGSARSTPRLTPSSSCSALPTALTTSTAAADNSPAASGIVSPALPLSPRRNASLAETAGVEPNKKKKKEKKDKERDKKEKKGRPQNALFSLAGTISGGAPPSANVVDLRALDPFPSHGGSKRSGRSANENVPPTQILGFLYLGSVRDAQDPSFLSKHDIRYIINVSQEEYWSVDKRVQIFTFKVDDSASADIASLFEPTRSLINNVRERYYRNEAAGKSSRPAVLVHCQKGRSRSATIVLAYLIYMNGWSVAEAMKYVATRRSCVEPNIGFMEELRKLQESLSAEERTKRYSELCWFMRNLDAQTAEAHVRELFEHRVGFVRDVVMLTSPASSGSAASNCDGATPATGPPPQRDGVCEQKGEGNSMCSPNSQKDVPILSFSLGDDNKAAGAGGEESTTGDAGSGAAAFPPSAVRSAATIPGDGGADPSHEAQGSAHIKSPPSTTPTKRAALCFVFMTCREDILRGIKLGQLRTILQSLHPAAGKQIKFATGPKLRKLMTEHQSMSASFASDMAQFSSQMRQRDSEEGVRGCTESVVSTPDTKGIAAPTAATTS